MNIKFLNLLNHHKNRTKGERRNRGDEPIQVIIHIYMEMSQLNTLYIYFKQTKMLFLKTKTENRKAKQVLPGGWVLVRRGGYKEMG
jgi:hypothetical protein